MEGLIVIAAVVVLLVGVIYGLYTRQGSGIELRPWGRERGAPGAQGRDELSGRDEGEGSNLDQRGTDAQAAEGGDSGEPAGRDPD